MSVPLPAGSAAPSRSLPRCACALAGTREWVSGSECGHRCQGVGSRGSLLPCVFAAPQISHCGFEATVLGLDAASLEQSGCRLRVSITHTQVPALCSPNGHLPVPEGLQPKSQLSLATSARSWIGRLGRVWSTLPAGSRGQESLTAHVRLPAEETTAFWAAFPSWWGEGSSCMCWVCG